MSLVNRKKIYVATYKEIIIGFLAFCIILIVLYPKDFLQKQVLAENSNYDITMLYLKNMLRNDPSNEVIMLALAKQATKADKRDLAFRLLGLLKNSKNMHIRSESYLLSYTIAKQDYFYFKEKHNIQKEQAIYTKLQSLFHIIIKEHYYQPAKNAYFYKDALLLNDTVDAYLLTKERLHTTPHNITILKNAFYLSYKLKHYDASMHYLDTLITLDETNKNKWLNEQYFILLKAYSYKQASFYMQHAAQTSIYWRKRLAEFYLGKKQYNKAADTYMILFERATTQHAKRDLWLKAINTLRSGNKTREAVNLGYKYENYFFNDMRARIELLKLYLAANDLKRARMLSQKILKIKKIKR